MDKINKSELYEDYQIKKEFAYTHKAQAVFLSILSAALWCSNFIDFEKSDFSFLSNYIVFFVLMVVMSFIFYAIGYAFARAFDFHFGRKPIMKSKLWFVVALLMPFLAFFLTHLSERGVS